MSDLEEESESDEDDYIKRIRKKNFENQYLDKSNLINVKKNNDNNVKSKKQSISSPRRFRKKKMGSVILNKTNLNLSPFNNNRKSYEIDEKELKRREKIEKKREKFLSHLTEEKIDDFIEEKIFTTKRNSITKFSIFKKMKEENEKKLIKKKEK